MWSKHWLVSLETHDVEDSDDSGECVRLFLIPAHPGYHRFQNCKLVAVIVDKKEQVVCGPSIGHVIDLW